MRTVRGWVHEGRFPDAKDVRDLPEILENDAAMEAFEQDGARAAKLVLQERNPSLVSNLWATVDRAISELKTTPLVEIEDLRSGHEPKVKKLRELQSAIDVLARHAELTLR